MTDEEITYSKTLVVERRNVERRKVLVGGNDSKPYPQQLYFVVERQGAGWLTISKGYPHSTSAYAKLGRITAHQSLHRV
jgi:hypothetical protein